MKSRILFAAIAAAFMTGSAFAITVDGTLDAGYGSAVATDPTGDPVGGDPVDLSGLYITDDGTDLFIALEINVDVATTDWGKYCLFINSPNLTGTSTTDQWGRAATSTSNYQFHSWVDSGGGAGFNLWNDGGSTWDPGAGGEAFAFAGGGVPSYVEASIPLANLGNPTTIDIAAWTTAGGGGDNAQDSIPTPSGGDPTDWSTTVDVDNFYTYNVTGGSSVSDWMLMD